MNITQLEETNGLTASLHQKRIDSLRSLALFGRDFRADPYPTYAFLQQIAPVYHRINQEGQRATCFITRYSDALAVLRDTEHFVKDYRNTLSPQARAELPAEDPLMRLVSRHMLNSDAPEHTRLRALVSKAFTVRMVEQLEGRVQDIADTLLDKVQKEGKIDLIETYAFPLPIIVMAELLGILARDRNRFRAWSHALLQPSPNAARNSKKLEKSRQVMEDFIKYLRRILAERRAKPKPDLITSLVQAEEAGDVLSEDEIFSTLLLLIVVGHETSVNLIGNGMLTLLKHPQQMEQLRQEPALLPNAIEELIRYDGPVERAPMRFAAEDVVVGEQLIRRGDAVSVVLAAANRDPTQFEQPEQLDLLRLNNRHLGFGFGAHYCLGAALARLEGRIGIGTLLRRLPGLRLAVDVKELRWHTNPIMRGLHQLPVVWEEQQRI